MRTKKSKPPDLRKYLKEGGRRLVTYDEGAKIYRMSRTRFMKLAKAAKANLVVKRWAIVNLDIFDKYIESQMEDGNESQT